MSLTIEIIREIYCSTLAFGDLVFAIIHSMNSSMADTARAEWTPTLALPSIFWLATLIFTCMCIASFPFFSSFPLRLDRWTALSVLVVPTGGAFRTAQDLTPDDTFNDIYLRFVIILVSHITYVSFRDWQGSKVSTGSASPRRRNPWLSGFKLGANPRGVGTEYEVPYLWHGEKSTAAYWSWRPSSKEGGARGTHTETAHREKLQTKMAHTETQHTQRLDLPMRGKWGAISIRLAYLLFNFLVICCWYELIADGSRLGITPSDYTYERSSIFRRMLRQTFRISRADRSITVQLPTGTSHHQTSHELLVRLHAAVANVLPDYLLLTSYHDVFAIFFLLTGLDDSWEWPPFFGSVAQAWSVRRFWGVFWHKLIYRSFSAHAAAITQALGVRQKTAFSRLLNNCMVFAMSGVMHGAVLWQFGYKCAWSTSMRYWMLQPVAFVLEGVVQAMWWKVRQSWLSGVRERVLVGVERAVGYAWVAAWLMWESPKRSFALRECNRRG
jgi:hypothetical protein